MKQIFTLAALLFIMLNAGAQSSHLKSSEGLKLQLDSLKLNYWDSHNEIWEPSGYHFEYDSCGRSILSYYDWTDLSSGEVIGEEGYEYTYNADGTLAECLELGWNDDSADWRVDDWILYSYDEDGNQTSYVEYGWDRTSEQWIRDDSIFNTYDENGLLLQYEGFEWKTDRWVIRYLSQYSYEEDGWMTVQLHRMWYEDVQEWKNNIKWVYTYNAAGQMLSKTRYDQEVYEGTWVEDSRQEQTFDAAGLQLTSAWSIWETDHWKMYRTDTMAHNPSGLLSENLGYVMDLGVMRPDFKYTYAYDDSGNLTEYLQYDWSESLQQMENQRKQVYTYDLSYLMTDIITPNEDTEWGDDLFSGFYANIPLNFQVYYWRNDSWGDHKQGVFSYTERNVRLLGTDEKEVAMVCLYPNPVDDLLRVHLPENSQAATLTLYEITGRQVLRRKVDAGECISLAILPAGIYLYNLNVDGRIQGGKLVKR